MFGKLFKKKDKNEELANNLYTILVLEPPSSSDSDSLDPSGLEIEINHLGKFTEKRLLLLEAMLWLATTVAFDEDSTYARVKAIEKKIASEWLKRGLISSTNIKINDLCFKEVEKLLENPMKWSRNWLSDFYVGGEYEGLPGGPHYGVWGEQCHNEYQAMIFVIKEVI
jgi:hypothetical protein